MFQVSRSNKTVTCPTFLANVVSQFANNSEFLEWLLQFVPEKQEKKLCSLRQSFSETKVKYKKMPWEVRLSFSYTFYPHSLLVFQLFSFSLPLERAQLLCARVEGRFFSREGRRETIKEVDRALHFVFLRHPLIFFLRKVSFLFFITRMTTKNHRRELLTKPSETNQNSKQRLRNITDQENPSLL